MITNEMSPNVCLFPRLRRTTCGSLLACLEFETVMPHKALLFLVVFSCLFALSLGCAEQPQPCSADGLMAQNHARLPVGETYWLPLDGKGTCGGLRWNISAKPEGATARIVHGADDHGRLTPDVAGTWRLKASLGGAIRTLTVVEARTRPFHNLNYYPSKGLAIVGQQLWAVATLRHEIGRFDPVSMANQGTITVGPWPVAVAAAADGAVAVVAHRGNDTVGFVDVAAGRLIDSVWVGDEPSNLVVTADGNTAYVALATQAQIAVLDVARREVVARWQGPQDPLGMTLSEDGAVLVVASHRSGHTDRFPWGTDPKEQERDIALIDTTTGKVKRWLIDVGTTINSVQLSKDGKTLFAALLRNDIQSNLADPDDPSFTHAVVAFDVATGAEKAAADLMRQKGSGGHAVSLHGLALQGDKLWVAAEASDVVIALDQQTLNESQRVVVHGRPRSVTVAKHGVWALGGQDLVVHRIGDGAVVAATGRLGVDPRPADMAAGQRYFTGAGRQYGQNWSCNSCHTDGLTDTLTWNAGPFASRLVTRPFFWLEGTWPLGWQGYLSSIRNYAFTVNTNIGIRPVTDEAENLYAYLASLMPAPAANGRTQRDGSHSEAAVRGNKLYDGKAACAQCHALPLTANRLRVDNSITKGKADVPSLVGNYRQGVWLKHGEALTLRDAVVAALKWSKRQLDQSETDDLTSYIEELTDRHFFVLTSAPRAGAQAVAADRPITVVMNRPVWDDPANLSHVTIVDSAGNQVPVDVTVTGSRLLVTPKAPLKHAQKHTVKIAALLRSWDDRALFKSWSLALDVQPKPTIKLGGDYRWTVFMPAPKPDFSGFNRAITAPTTVVLYTTARASGADVAVDYADGLVYQAQLRLDGDTLILPPMPVPVGPSFADTFGSTAQLKDDDGDGIADSAQGELTIAGPGFEEAGVKWSLSRPPPVDGCEVGPVNNAVIDVTIDDKGRPVIAWDGGETNALGVYVTEVGANLPFGPGQKVTGGKTFWAATATKFPVGFKGPVTYGVVPTDGADASAEHGAPVGGAALAKAKCLQFGVISSKFEVLLFNRAL
jgi:DNA-binding beta-propeller fold protein YncE